MFLITNSKNVLIYKANSAVKMSKGIFINDDKVLISEPGTQLFEVPNIPDEVKPHKYCYTKNEKFYKNPDYVDYNPVSNELVSDMNDRLQATELAMIEMLNRSLKGENK